MDMPITQLQDMQWQSAQQQQQQQQQQQLQPNFTQPLVAPEQQRHHHKKKAPQPPQPLVINNQFDYTGTESEPRARTDQLAEWEEQQRLLYNCLKGLPPLLLTGRNYR